MGQLGGRMAPKRCIQPGAGEDGRVKAKQSPQNPQGLKGIFVKGTGKDMSSEGETVRKKEKTWVGCLTETSEARSTVGVIRVL